MIREQNFFLELLNRINYQQSILQTAAVNLGGTSGSGGGNGAPPGGFYGQLPQSKVAGDTTESFNYTSGSVVSLLSNLNNLRAFAEPATWFFPHETIPASQSLTIMSGLWHFSSGSVLQMPEQNYTFVPPTLNNRIDLLYVHTSGVYDVLRGTTAASPVAPTIPSPTSGSMPLAYIYLRSSGSAVHNIDRGESYVYEDLRPFLIWGLGGAASSVLLDPSTPQPVGSSGNVGSSGSASHGDHVHRGVSSVIGGGTTFYGDVPIVAGANISITTSSGSLVITSTGSGGGSSGSLVGYTPLVYPMGADPTFAFGTPIALSSVSPTVGGAVAVPFFLPSSMLLDTVSLRNLDNFGTRAAEWRLYEEPSGGSGTLNEVSGANGTWSITGAGAANYASQPGSPPITIYPGVYWLVVRCTDASNQWTAGVTGSTGGMATNAALTKNITALGSTLDMSSGWSKSTNMYGVVLQGRVLGYTSAF